MKQTSCSPEITEILRESIVLDLHLDTYLWTRLGGYNPHIAHHGFPWSLGWLFGQADLPRLQAAGFDAAAWIVTTNPLATAPERWRALQQNLAELELLLESRNTVRCVRTVADLLRAREAGVHGAMLGVQGGNALEAATTAERAALLERLTLVTLVHLTHSALGESSLPLPGAPPEPLTPLGGQLVEEIADARVFVDLAHLSRKAFWRALEVLGRAQPPLVSHSAVAAVTPHWRNLDDSQIRAVAERGGVVGLLYHGAFLRSPGARDGLELAALHLEHLRKVGGDGIVALGSDWDGFILPPRELKAPQGLAALLGRLRERGWSRGQLAGLLGGNFLRALEELSPEGRPQEATGGKGAARAGAERG